MGVPMPAFRASYLAGGNWRRVVKRRTEPLLHRILDDHYAAHGIKAPSAGARLVQRHSQRNGCLLGDADSCAALLTQDEVGAV